MVRARGAQQDLRYITTFYWFVVLCCIVGVFVLVVLWFVVCLLGVWLLCVVVDLSRFGVCCALVGCCLCVGLWVMMGFLGEL